MLYLSIALVFIFVLWLIDKHNKWRAVAKIFFGLVGLAVLGFAGLWGWGVYQNWKNEKAQALAWASHQAAVKACEKRFSAKGVFDTSLCESDPLAQTQPQPPATISDWVPVEVRHAKPVHLKRVKNKYDFDIAINTTEYGNLRCGIVKAGEVVTLLDDGGLFVKVRTPEGKVGWAEASSFEVVD